MSSDPTRRAERKFLASCLADPAAGADVLATASDQLFTGDLTRRVAEHLRSHLAEPGKDLPVDDEELAREISLLVHAASEMDGTRNTIEGDLRDLLIAHEEQLMDADRREGRPGIADRRKRIDEWRRERDGFIAGTMEASKPAD